MAPTQNRKKRHFIDAVDVDDDADANDADADADADANDADADNNDEDIFLVFSRHVLNIGCFKWVSEPTPSPMGQGIG